MYSHQNVTLRGFHFEDSSLTVNLDAAVNASHIGYAMTPDASGVNKMKLAGDGDPIVARLSSFEDRQVEGTRVGAVEFNFGNTLPIAEGSGVAVGSYIVGGGDGTVRPAVDGTETSSLFVFEVIGDRAVVVKA
jgi:hypothetical protein